jgi:hypothetical protein
MVTCSQQAKAKAKKENVNEKCARGETKQKIGKIGATGGV